MTYDKNNVFAKILRGEIPCNKITENEFALAFYDIEPQRKIHALVIPKGEYVSFDDFTLNAPPELQVGFYQTVQKIASDLGVGDTGYRLIANHAEHSGQEVPHFHVHILGGEPVGKLVG